MGAPENARPNGPPLKEEDPLAASTLGIYFFLVAEAMFFVGLLGSFVVLGSAGEQQRVFGDSAKMLSAWLGIGSLIMLLMSSALLVDGTRSKWSNLFFGFLFIVSQCRQCFLLIQHDALWQNNFFGCYFILSAALSLHVLIGMIAIVWYLLTANGKLPEFVQIYWHFAGAVSAASLFALYLLA